MRVICTPEWILFSVKVISEIWKGKVKINSQFRNEFISKYSNISAPQGTVLSLLRFIIVLDALSFEFRIGYSLELIYMDNLAIIF